MKLRKLPGIARLVIIGLFGAALSTPTLAADKVNFRTVWFAQAEHGGYYQAKATGLYEKAGLDVTIKQGGPQISVPQLLLAGEADIIMGNDIQVLKLRETNAPLVAVATTFQFDLQGMMAHDDIADLADLKGKPIFISGSARQTFWPWLRARYGYTDDQIRAYTFNLQPFFADKGVAQQAYQSSELYQAEQKGEKVKFFLFGDSGYPPYGSPIVTTEKMIAERPDVVARFVKASMEGWRDYLKNPAPGNALIKADNPKMSDEQLAYAVDKLRQNKSVEGGEAASQGIGIMTAARWKATYDFMVASGLLDPKTEWQKSFTDRFVKDLKIAF